MLDQLAADINFFLLRGRSLRRMSDFLAEIRAARTFPFKGKRLKLIEDFHQRNQAFATFLGYTNPRDLLDNKVVDSAMARLITERKRVRYKSRLVRDAIYSHTAGDYSGDPPEADLEEAKIVPILTKISAAGFNFLSRAGALYEDALTRKKNQNALQWLQRLSRLESRFYEHELMKLVSR